MIYEFEFAFTSHPTIWVRTDVTVNEALDCIKTGLLRNVSVEKIKLFAITEGTDSVSFVYNIAQAKSGVQPWSLLESLGESK